jgi:putative DNA primase/helicase
MATPRADQLPKELTCLNHIVAWRTEIREGSTKPTKVPYNLATGQKARSNHPEDWAAFPDPSDVPAIYDGIGFMFTKEAGIFGVDLDDCIDPETNIIKPWAVRFVKAFQHTYPEISPSGTGIKIFALCPDPAVKSSWIATAGQR